MKRNKEKGFTLIELLAVIIILGVLMIIAVPSVTKYITNTRKSAYIDTAKEIIGATRNKVNEGKLEMYDTDVTYYIDARCIHTENSLVSPYGEFDKAYVIVTYDGTKYYYYWTSVDETGHGTKKFLSFSYLDEEEISTDIKESDIMEGVGLDLKHYYVVIDENCNKSARKSVTARVSSITGGIVVLDFDIVSDDPNGYIYYGDVVHFVATINGYENYVYKIRWEYSLDKHHWTTISSENWVVSSAVDESTLDIKVTQENANYWYRLVLYDFKKIVTLP